MTATEQPVSTLAIAAVRAEFERSISDAYAGGPAGRDRVWRRLEPLIDAYAAARVHETTTETEQPSPILPPEPATAPAVAPEATDTPTPRAKPTARKATS